jgi:hypothetical protein
LAGGELAACCCVRGIGSKMGLIYCICESLVQDLTLWNRIGVERTARGADMTIVASIGVASSPWLSMTMERHA